VIMTYIHIATEDELSEAIAEKLIITFTQLTIHLKLRRGGNGYLRSNLKSFFEIANKTPILLLTDLDTVVCPPALLIDWKSSVNIPQPSQMFLRVVVREIEAWLLADHSAASALLGTTNLPINPDAINDPKKELMRLAANASRDVRDDIIPKRGAAATQGIGYNARLVNFVRDGWCPDRASERSDSLRRCCAQLRMLDL
jgi:hypothetical protein